MPSWIAPPGLHVCSSGSQVAISPASLPARSGAAHDENDSSRRAFLQLLAGAVAAPATSRLAQAQTYPARPVTLIVPFAAGGSTDILGRIVTDHMARTLGQRFIVENVVGAGGTTGTIRMMRASPDGYTIQVGQLGTHVAEVAFYPGLAYKPDEDFAPIGLIAEQHMVISVSKSISANTLAEFMAYAKANPDRLNMGHAGVGSITHFTCVLLNSLLGIKPAVVPFNSSALAMNALIGGHVDFMCGAAPDVVPQAQSGTIKLLAVGSPKRIAPLPNVPTSIEAGLPDFQALPWFALFAPKGTPKPMLDRLVELGCDVPDKPQRGQQALAALTKRELAPGGCRSSGRR
jgi:tripartite-type tricarboxylate transporter receptor subunit TctC